MKLHTHLLAFGAVGILVAAIVGSVGLASASRQEGALDEVLQSSASVRESMDGDMMHDAIRGDALAALLAAVEADKAGLDAATKALAEHRKRFDAVLAELDKQPSSDEVRGMLARVRPVVAAYGQAAEAVQQAARTNVAAAREVLPGFQDKFDALEVAMEQLGDAILKQAQVSADEGRVAGQHAHLLILAMIAGAAAVLAAVSFVLSRRLVRPLRRAVEVADGIAGGDLSVTVPPGSYAESAALMQSLERMRSSLVQLSGTVLEQARQVAGSAQQVAAGSEAIEGDARRSHADIEVSREALQSVGGDIQGNLAQTREADGLARSAAQVARDGGEAVARVVQTMGGITESSRRIGDIIAVIDGIAFQTNILALNAAVEAARAGEQGRGFAVVASEVRALAQRSASAAREIKALISESIERVDAGRAQVDEAGATMQHIVESIGRVSDLIARISDATTRQSDRIGEVESAFLRVDATMGNGTTLTRQSSAAAAAMMEQAQRLLSAASGFRVA